MKYRNLGKTNIRVSEIGVGCSGFWGNQNYSEKEAHQIIFEAVARGVNFFDTGHNYCNFNAEPRLGRALKEVFKDNKRENFVISTKGGTTIGKARILRPKSQTPSNNFSPDYIESTIKNCISNLNCDYLDIFQLHGFPGAAIEEGRLIERLLKIKNEGLIRSIGVNIHTKKDMLFVAEHSDIFDMVLIDYNVLQIDREEIIKKLKEAGVGVVAGTVLAQGHLIKGKIGSLRSLSDFWYLLRAFLKPASRTLMRNSYEMREVLSKIEGMSSAQAATSYVLANEGISSCIFGTTKMKNLIDMINATEKALTQKDVILIKKAFKNIKVQISH